MVDNIPIIDKSVDTMELIYYNRLFGKIVKIEHATWGFNTEQYFPILSYVKTRLPQFNLTVNVYEFLSAAGFHWETLCLIDYSFELGSLWKLPNQLIEDLIEQIPHGGFSSEKNYINIVNFMIECCRNGYADSIYRNVNRDNFWNEHREFHLRKYCQSISTQIHQYAVILDILI
jgi:hypothetical protein